MHYFRGMKLQLIEGSGIVDAVLMAPHSNDFLTERREQLSFGFEGIPGDRHFGYTKKAGGRDAHYPRGTEIRNSRQWSAVCPAELSRIASRMEIAHLEPEWIGANLLISGISRLSMLPPFSHLRFSRNGEEVAVLVVSEQNMPCRFPDRLIQQFSPTMPGMGFAKAGLGLRGLVGWVDRPGVICVGDNVKVEVPEVSPDLQTMRG